MRGSRAAAVTVLALLPMIWSCAGDGTGLDEFGNPLGTSIVPMGPTLTSIQANIFNPICTPCHTGASAPQGLALDEGVARQNLVSVPSREMPNMVRIYPGYPDSSYLVWKIEGRSEIIGGRMPFQLPPLHPEQIDAIKGWIAGGALDN